MTLERRYAQFLARVPGRSETIDGVTWRWREQGEGELALVILPGAVGGADLFFLLFEALAPSIRVLAVDLPFVADGRRLAAQLDALLGARGVERAILLGASFSGLFVQAYARQYGGRTRALILSHTGALDPSRADRQRRSARRAARIPIAFLRALLRLVVRMLLRGVDDVRFWTARYDAALAELDRTALVSRYLLEASIEDLGAGPWDGDVLIIHSDKDPVVKPVQRARLRAAYPRAQWVEFRGAGHSSYTRNPAAYSAAVEAFVSRFR